jgi:hypothetical protein
MKGHRAIGGGTEVRPPRSRLILMPGSIDTTVELPGSGSFATDVPSGMAHTRGRGGWRLLQRGDWRGGSACGVGAGAGIELAST